MPSGAEGNEMGDDARVIATTGLWMTLCPGGDGMIKCPVDPFEYK